MAIQFNSPQIVFDGIKGLFSCKYTVSGNPSATVAEGVGDTEYQAKRHAVVTYQKENPLAFLNIP